MKPESIGRRIAQLRTHFNMSQRDLAELLHISPSAVGMYEQGRRAVPLDIIVKISSYFSVSTHFLLTGQPFVLHESQEKLEFSSKK